MMDPGTELEDDLSHWRAPPRWSCFVTEQSHAFCADPDSELSSMPNEDVSMLRWVVMGESDLNADAKWAIELAQSHARDNGWTLNDEIYFN